MHDDLDMMRLHVESLFTHDARGRMLRVNELGGRAIAPRLYFGRTAAGHVLRVRADVSDVLAAELQAIVRDEPIEADVPQRPHCGALLRAALARSEPVRHVWAGPAYGIDPTKLPAATNATCVERDDSPLLRTFPDWHGEVALRQPFVVALDGDAAAAVCCSVRITPRAHAAGVETLAGARQRGFATQAVIGWAQAVAERGALAFYSTSWDNIASQAVARRLRMHQYGVDFHIT